MCFVRAIDDIDAASFEQVRFNPSFSALCGTLVEALGEDLGLQASSEFLATLLQSELLTYAGRQSPALPRKKGWLTHCE